jgi:hypothetical protein
VRRFALRERLARAAEVPLAELGSWEPPKLVAAHTGADDFSAAPGEWALVRALIFDLAPHQRLDLIELLPTDALEHPIAATLFQVAAGLLKRGEDIDIARLINEFDDPNLRRVLAAIEFRVPEMDARRLAEDLRVTWERAWRRRLGEARNAHAAALKAGEGERAAALTEELSSLIQQKKGREHLLGEIEQLLARSRPPGPGA